MKNFFEELLKYGFHDTEITAVKETAVGIELYFANGIYVIENEKESYLTDPIKMCIEFLSPYCGLSHVMEIVKFRKKISHRYMEFVDFKKKLENNDSFGISMLYYSHFDYAILLDGGITKENLLIIFSEIKKISFEFLEK